jgi:hypothetical protein
MSQGSLNVPTTGPVSPTAMAGDINAAADALVSKNSGASAPANFPTSPGAPTTYQEWADTSPGASITDLKLYDGASWLPTGSMDGVNHVWMPKVGGNSDTIASGATVDVGSKRSAYITITGSVPGTPITSFGSNALLTTGETKFLRFAAAGILTYNAASMILPGAADLPFNAGDSLQALYLGGGNWLAYNYRSNVSAVGRNTGDLFEKWGTSAITGAVRCNGGTVGNGASGGTERANADTVNLFIFLYINDTGLTVSGGRTAPGNTRAAAITDFNLNKTITLPTLLAASGLPTRQYLLSGSGATYTTPAGCTKIIVRGVGGGGGGGGTGSAGSSGGTTIFNSINANGGSGGGQSNGNAGGAGGTGGSGSASFRIDGGDGTFNSVGGGGSLQVGMRGGSSVFGGAGRPGQAGKTNTGGGGGGFGSGSNQTCGGGGAGEYIEIVISSPAATYTYTVGGGGATGSGSGGGAGGSGVIIVDEFYGSSPATKYFAL